MQPPCPDNHYLAEHLELLRRSYQRLTGKDFGPTALNGEAYAQVLYQAPFVLVSHDTQADPVFNYGNLCAQRLFELTWNELTQLPSRQSAEPPNQDERARLLQAVTTQGFYEGYSGVRISKTGQRFLIQDVTVWNVTDNQGQYQGQAAIYSRWQFLD
jgi:hypothetical protein